MVEIIITCDDCNHQYFGDYYDSEVKKGKHGKYREETYQAQCTVCDKPIFTTRKVKL